MVASFHDGSALPEQRLYNGRMEVHTTVEMRGGGRRDLQTKELKMSDKLGVWEYYIDIKDELNLQGPRSYEELNDISKYFIVNPFAAMLKKKHALSKCKAKKAVKHTFHVYFLCTIINIKLVINCLDKSK